MKLNRTDSPITGRERVKINENWMMIQDDFNNVVSKISDEAFKEVVDNAKLNWLPEYVDTYEDIATIYPNPEEGDTTMARHASADFPTDPDDKRDAGVVWRFDGTEWQPIQQIDVSAFNQAFDELNKEIGSVQSNLTGHETDLDNPHQVNPDQIGANHSQVFDIRSYDDDIQSALTACYNAGGGTVFIPDGLYEITETLEIYANTHLLLSHNAVLKKVAAFSPMLLNGQKGVDSFAGYNGNGNITIEGGTINGNGTEIQVRSSEIMFAHGYDIVIKNVRFIDNYDSHMIEINSSKNVKIYDNTFEKQTMDTAQNRYPEMIQLDLATEEGFPHFGEWDGTPCQGVIITNNYFTNGIRGIGTHSSLAGEDYIHKNIIISNNTFITMEAQCIRGQDWWNVSVNGNTMEYVGSGIESRAESNTVHYWNITGNILKNSDRLEGIFITNNTDNSVKTHNFIIDGNILAHTRGNGRAIYAREISSSIISNNKITSPLQDGIFVRDSGSHVVVEGNHIYGAGREGIYIYNGTQRVIVQGNYIYNSARTGIQIHSAEHSLIANNIIWFANGVNGEGGFCIYVSNGSAYTNVVGNKCVGVSTGAQIIYISGNSNYVLVNGNHTSAGGNEGVYATSSCSYVFVTGNMCIGNDIVASGTGSQITNNLTT